MAIDITAVVFNNYSIGLIHLAFIHLYESLELPLQFKNQLVIAENLHLQTVDGHAVLLVLFQARLIFFFVGFIFFEEVGVRVH